LAFGTVRIVGAAIGGAGREQQHETGSGASANGAPANGASASGASASGASASGADRPAQRAMQENLKHHAPPSLLTNLAGSRRMGKHRGSAGRACAVIAAGIAALAIVPQAMAAADRWEWLQNTYWYVPPANLLALASSPSLKSPIPVSDQTVYRIDRYAGGYFWGSTAVAFASANGSSDAAPSCLQLVGSVTPEGNVHLTFTLLSSKANSTPTVGLGVMTRKAGAWAMENQMSTAAVGNLLLTHWAYMAQCKPAEPCFAALPGSGLSIPEFLATCKEAGPAS
jgi:hypothetical protein